MKNNKAILIVILVFVVLVAGAYILYNSLSGGESPSNILPDGESMETENASEAEGAAQEVSYALAPDFTVYDKEGNEVKLSDFKGKPVVINFWASWCAPCRNEMPSFEKLYQELGEDVQFMMVNLTGSPRESATEADALLNEEGYTFPVFYDHDSDASYTYGASQIPATYFVDADGKLVTHGIGALSEETLRTGIEKIVE